MKCAIRACLRVDKDTRETFDANTPPFGVFITNKIIDDDISWKNRTVSFKIQAALRFKEMCNLTHGCDSFSRCRRRNVKTQNLRH